MKQDVCPKSFAGTSSTASGVAFNCPINIMGANNHEGTTERTYGGYHKIVVVLNSRKSIQSMEKARKRSFLSHFTIKERVRSGIPVNFTQASITPWISAVIVEPAMGNKTQVGHKGGQETRGNHFVH